MLSNWAAFNALSLYLAMHTLLSLLKFFSLSLSLVETTTCMHSPIQPTTSQNKHTHTHVWLQFFLNISQVFFAYAHKCVCACVCVCARAILKVNMQKLKFLIIVYIYILDPRWAAIRGVGFVEKARLLSWFVWWQKFERKIRKLYEFFILSKFFEVKFLKIRKCSNLYRNNINFFFFSFFYYFKTKVDPILSFKIRQN